MVNSNGLQKGPVRSGSFISIFGSNLAASAMQASGASWPNVLEATSVFINGIAAPLGYVSPNQINAQVPNSTLPGQATVTVVVGDRVLAPVELTVASDGHIKRE